MDNGSEPVHAGGTVRVWLLNDLGDWVQKIVQMPGLESSFEISKEERCSLNVFEDDFDACGRYRHYSCREI